MEEQLTNETITQESGVNGEFAAPETNETENNEIENTGGVTGTQEGEAGLADQQQREKPVQTPEQNRAFAELRRRAERAEKKLEQYNQLIKEKFGQTHGLYDLDSYFNAVTQTLEQQQARQQAEMERYREQREKELEEMGYNVREIREIFRNDPVFQQMVKENQELKRQIEEERKRRETERISQQIQQDHQYLKNKYGDLVPDLNDLDEQTIEYMRQGMPLRAAFLLANEDKILEAARSRTKASTLRNVNSKAHLGTAKSEGPMEMGIQVELSPEKLAIWRALGYSEKEARKRELKYLKRQRAAK